MSMSDIQISIACPNPDCENYPTILFDSDGIVEGECMVCNATFSCEIEIIAHPISFEMPEEGDK